MLNKMVKFDLRNGLNKDFIKNSLALSKDILSKLPLNEYDLVITSASNRNYDINSKVSIEFFMGKLEDMLVNAFEYFKDRKVEKWREVLTFEVELFKVINVENYYCEVNFDIWTKQLSLASGTGYSRISICLAKEQAILDKFNSDLVEFKLSKEQMDKLFEIYEEQTPLYRKLTNIDEYLMQGIESVILEVIENDKYSFKFTKENILKSLKEVNDDSIKLFIDKLEITELKNDDEEISAITISLFDKSNEIRLIKKELIEIYEYEEII